MTKTPTKKKLILTTIAFTIAVGLAFNHRNDEKAENKTEISIADNLEIPTKIQGRQEQIITHTGYTVSYNADWKIPNWVAYELTKEEAAGTVPRDDAFMPDPEVSESESATLEDYKHSGWDRGHMIPAADTKWSRQAMKESFYLSNICPQNQNLNRGVWQNLEEQVRDWATEEGNIYVVCGPIVSEESETIGENAVIVPDAFFKVLLQKRNNEFWAVAFLFANESGRKPLLSYTSSVREIENITGIDFFPALPDDVEDKIESQVEF